MAPSSNKKEFQFINISNAEESRSDEFLFSVRSHIAKNHVYVNKPRNQPRKKKQATDAKDKKNGKGAQAERKKKKTHTSEKSALKALVRSEREWSSRGLKIPICTSPECKDAAPHLVTACDLRYLRELSPQTTMQLFLERLRPNSALDPFNSLPCEPTPYTHKAILGAHEMVRDRFHSYNTWLQRSLADGELLSGLILCVMTSIFMNKNNPEFPMDIILDQKATALQNLNKILRDTKRNLTDDIVFLIITMAEHEVSFGNPFTFSCHVEGLRRILELRNRPGAEPIGPMLTRAAGWLIAIHIHFLDLDGMYATPSSSSPSTPSPSAESSSTQSKKSLGDLPTPPSLIDKTCPTQRILHSIKGTIFIMNSILKHCGKDSRSVWRIMLDLEDVVEACHCSQGSLAGNETAREIYFRLIADKTQFSKDMTLLISQDSSAYDTLPRNRYITPEKYVHDDVPDVPLAVFEAAKIAIECVTAALETVFQPEALPSNSYFVRAQAQQWLERPYFDHLIGFPFQMVKDFGIRAAQFDGFNHSGYKNGFGTERHSDSRAGNLVILPKEV